MSFSPITLGSLAWGTPVNDAFVALDEQQMTNARDHGLKAWAFDPAANSGSSSLTAGTPFMTKLWIRQPTTITNIVASITSAGATLTAGQNFAGLYNSSGTRLGVTADQSVAWTTTGLQTMALTAPVAVAAGAYYATLLFNGTTSPTWGRGAVAGSGASTINAGLTATNGRYATGPAAQTSLPLSITMASRTLSAISMWSAVS